MNILDLFSGIGGFSKAAHDVDSILFKTIAFCEIDNNAGKVLEKNFPGITVFKDITNLAYDPEGYGSGKYLFDRSDESIVKLTGEIDIICGGFPCQDISVAGQKRGINKETRSGLWFQYKRLIKEIKPRWVIIENVRNLLNNGLATVLKDLSDLGYNAEWEIISAESVGAPHKRERSWIVVYKKISNSDDFRFWPTFTSEEEKLKWWTEATASISNRWKTEPAICRVDDGLSEGLDKCSGRTIEKHRKEQIKQLGNSIVPGIAEIIFRRIKEIENI